MKKIIILAMCVLLLTGCGYDNEKIDGGDCLESYCDTEYDVEYIRDVCVYRGGITIRLDNNGNIIRCKKG